MSRASRRRRADHRRGTGSTDFVIEESLGYLINRVARQMAHQLSEAIRPDGVGPGSGPSCCSSGPEMA